MPIYRAPKEDGNFVQVLNSVVRDPRISYRAVGVFVRSLSNIDEWVMTAEELRGVRDAKGGENNREGRDAIESALDELRAYGYRIVTTNRDKKGRFTRSIDLIEMPATPAPGIPLADTPGLDPHESDHQPSEDRISVSQAILEDQLEEQIEDYENIQSSKNSKEDVIEPRDLLLQEEVLEKRFNQLVHQYEDEFEVKRYLGPFWSSILSETPVVLSSTRPGAPCLTHGSVRDLRAATVGTRARSVLC